MTIIFIIFSVSIFTTIVGISYFKILHKNGRIEPDYFLKVSKEIKREKGKIIYLLNFEIKNSDKVKNYSVYITKEEYDLLNDGDEITFLYDTETKSLRLDEEKFQELIKTLKDKENTK